MSFWSDFSGPHWWDCIESFNPCTTQAYGLYDEELVRRPRRCQLPRGMRIVTLFPRHAKEVETLLREEFSLYPRCKIALSEARIQQGLFLDNWIGLAVYTIDKKMIGCCISRPLGRLKLTHEVVPQAGVVDYFCVHHAYRKQGIASCLLEELVHVTARQGRLVHIFLKEGFPLWKLPPLYTSQYIVRRREIPGEGKDYFGSMGIALHSPIQSYTHADYLPITKFAANLPYQLSGDSEIFSFNYRGHSIFLCMTDLYHRVPPKGERVGELSWMLPQTIEVPLAIQKLAVETCIDCSKFDIVLMDKCIPHDSKQAWRNDASFSWYIFNYNPGTFFSTKPFWIF